MTNQEKQEVSKEIKYGGFWIRFAAALLDGIVLNAVISVIMVALKQPYGLFNLNSGSTSDLLWSSTWQTYVSTGLQWLYNILMLKYYGGATLGKMALRLRVIKTDGELDWISIILRETIGKFVSGIILGIGYMMAGWDPKKQALHDKIAGTYVIRG